MSRIIPTYGFGPYPKPVPAKKKPKGMKRVSDRRTAHKLTPEGKRDKAYLAALHGLPCCICEAFGLNQRSPTTAHHWIMDRYSQAKTSDIEALPLCDGHHQGSFDHSKIAIHRQPALWRETYGPDFDWIAVTQDKLSHLLEITK